MPNASELNPEWPHALLKRYPDEVHISPRTAYFMQDGKVMFLQLETLEDEAIAEAGAQLRNEGVDYPEQ